MNPPIPHIGKSVYFSCIDDRLDEAHAAFIRTLPGGAFEPAMAGGGAAILDETDRASALKQIVAAYKINQIIDVYLECHTDCGAYQLAGITFSNPQEELERLYGDLDQASTLALNALKAASALESEITIHTRVVDPTGQLMERPIH